jgi:hypothetical protein
MPQIKIMFVKKSDFTLSVILPKNISEYLLHPTGFYNFDFKFRFIETFVVRRNVNPKEAQFFGLCNPLLNTVYCTYFASEANFAGKAVFVVDCHIEVRRKYGTNYRQIGSRVADS